MSDEPSHKAMLYFLEVLMNSSGSLTISQLAGRFGSSNFTPEMRTAAGGNETGLKQFLQKYPSLFTIRGNMVSLCDGKEEEDSSTGQDSCASSLSASSSRRSLPDVSVEMDAVQFFQTQLTKREEKWVQIKSLAGHLSQTTPEIRNIVGPQLEFRKWLLRHMHIFEVQGEMVTLRDGLAPPPATPGSQRRITFDLPDDGLAVLPLQPVPPKTPPAQRRVAPKNVASLHRSHSFGDRSQIVPSSQSLGASQVATPSPVASLVKRHNSPVTMTANEYKAVIFLKETLEKKGLMKITLLLGSLSSASDSIRSTVGSTKNDLEEFLKRNAGIFTLPGDDNVELVKNAKLSVVITGSKPATPAASGGTNVGRVFNSGKGKIFHVAKLWGIIDLGEHEHVFFDRSIMQKQMDDLQKYFEIGEMLCFNAVLAHKTSRAKWKATRVWKEHEQEPIGLESDQESLTRSSMGSSVSIEDEINEFLPQPDLDRSGSSDPVAVYGDANLSVAGVVPIWNFKQDEDKNKKASVSVVPESYQMSASALSDLRFVSDFGSSFLLGSGKSPSGTGLDTSGQAGMPNGMAGKTDPRLAANVPKQKKMVNVACQTVSTSDIIATQLYQDG